MYELPTSVELNGESFEIRDKGDFRMILHLFELLNTDDLDNRERIIASLILFYKDFKTVDDVYRFPYIKEAVEKMFDFIDCGQSVEQKSSGVKLVDWDKDSTLICSAVNNVAGKEIRAEKYLHWWTFIGYYMAIGDCALSQIIGIRYKIAHAQKLEKHEKKFKQENPQYFMIDMRNREQRDADEYVQSLWNGGID